MWRIFVWIGHVIVSTEWWIATHLPRRIVYLCVARATADYARKHPHVEVPSITSLQAMDGVMPAKVNKIH